MLKNILKLDGAQGLSKSEQKNLNGGSSRFVCTATTAAHCKACCCGVWLGGQCLHPTNGCA